MMNLHPQFFRAGPNTRRSADPSGFSLMEVLIALVIAAVLSSALLSIQAQSVSLGDHSDLTWGNVNMAQEFIARRYPDEMVNPTGSWVRWPHAEDAKYELSKDTVKDDEFTDAMSLSTEYKGDVMTWEWYRPHPLYRIKE